MPASSIACCVHTTHFCRRLRAFVEEGLRFVDLGGEIGASTAIWVIQHNDFTMLLSNDLFCDASLTRWMVSKASDKVKTPDSRDAQYQSSLSFVHALLEPSFIERTA